MKWEQFYTSIKRSHKKWLQKWTLGSRSASSAGCRFQHCSGVQEPGGEWKVLPTSTHPCPTYLVAVLQVLCFAYHKFHDIISDLHVTLYFNAEWLEDYIQTRLMSFKFGNNSSHWLSDLILLKEYYYTIYNLTWNCIQVF